MEQRDSHLSNLRSTEGIIAETPAGDLVHCNFFQKINFSEKNMNMLFWNPQNF